jgi:hypothetical protein
LACSSDRTGSECTISPKALGFTIKIFLGWQKIVLVTKIPFCI